MHGTSLTVMPAWIAGIQVFKDESGHIHCELGSQHSLYRAYNWKPANL